MKTTNIIDFLEPRIKENDIILEIFYLNNIRAVPL